MDENRRWSFAQILDDLCRTTSTPGGERSYSNVELARVVFERGGKVTHSYIAQLRRGRRDNPTLRQIELFAEVFDVHPAYFVGGRRDRSGPSASSFAAKLNVLFANVPRPGGGAFTNDAVATAVRGRGHELDDPGWTIAPNTVADLRNGVNTNPTLKQLLGIADCFAVKPPYFLDDDLAARIEEQISHAKRLRELGIHSVVARVTEVGVPLSDEARNGLVRALVDALRPLGVTPEAVRNALRSDGAGADDGGG